MGATQSPTVQCCLALPPSHPVTHQPRPSYLQVCVLNRLRLMQALHCMQWKKSTPRPWPRLHTLQNGQW